MKVRVLVTGASGMLGHVVFRMLSRDPDVDVEGTIRRDAFKYSQHGKIAESDLIMADLSRGSQVDELLGYMGSFDFVVNCAGVVSQVIDSVPKEDVIMVNSVFPHRVARALDKHGGRLIHISTDCVFSGKHGGYFESDVPDPVDFYGRSKFLGEVVTPPHLTLRTSIVGRQLGDRKYGLLEWFLSQSGNVNGYSRVLWSGVTTVFLAEVIHDLICGKIQADGLLHVPGETRSKFDMLNIFKEVYERPDLEVTRVGFPVLDKTFASTRQVGIQMQTFESMVAEMRGFDEYETKSVPNL